MTMSATNSTPNLNLPVFVGTDKPAWLVDFNGAMNAIDSAVGANTTNISGNATAISNLNNSVSALNTTVGNQTTTINNLVTATTNNAGAINTINSLIGNGTPTTTDQTIIGAINELHSNQGDLTNLTTTDKTSLVAAINEVAGGGGGGGSTTAANVSYDNTSSGLTASNVQAAIDEVVTMIPSGGGGGFSEKGSHVFSSIAAGANDTQIVTFTGTYTNTPTVIISLDQRTTDSSGISTTGNDFCLPFAIEVSNTSCKLMVANKGAAAVSNVRISYIVISND